MTIDELIRRDAKKLGAALPLDHREAHFEVQLLLGRACGVNRAYLIAHSDEEIDSDSQRRYLEMLDRRMQGEPMAYIFGSREFLGMEFLVTPDTLIPRPDTELLVELALQRIPDNSPCKVLDLGTGSGIIAISIGRARPVAQVLAVDFSEVAIEVARRNAARLDASNVDFAKSDWFEKLAGEKAYLIVSNPPYIAEGDPHLADLEFEPITALTSGADGLDAIRKIVASAPEHLLADGWLLLEHGYDQAEKCRALFAAAGFSEIFSAVDLSGIERVTGGRLTARA